MRTIGTLVLTIFYLLTSIASSNFSQTNKEKSILFQETNECIPDTGWRWVNGESQPLIEELIISKLLNLELLTEVDTLSYGEIDLCNNFLPRGIDISITIKNNKSLEVLSQADVIEIIKRTLSEVENNSWGNIKVIFPQGDMVRLHLEDNLDNAINQDYLSWNNIQTTDSPSARWGSGIAFDSDQKKIILFGGDDTGANRLNDTWEFYSGNWVLKSPTTKPAGRVNITRGMVFDSWRDTTVLFGGLSSDSYLNDTWEYADNSWSNISTQRTPCPRDAHAMVFDEGRGKVILFGGHTYSGSLNDTWEYNGDWQLLTLPTQPSIRDYHSMAYDQERGVVVLFGGKSDEIDLNDTWEFDGIQWRQIITPNTPSARSNHGMTYDSFRGTVILFGGNHNGNTLNDTWEYNGQTWTQVITLDQPSPRQEMSMTFNSDRNRVFLFGGGVWSAFNNETWEYPFSIEYDPLLEIKRKVYIIGYNPFVDSEKTVRLWEYLDFNSYEDITKGTIDFFYKSSGGQIQYEVVETTILDEFPEKIDGFSYTISEYLNVINHLENPHNPDSVNYNKIVNDPRLDICGKANRNEIDEVWIFNGPYYGFWESTLVGPNAYWYNSVPVAEPFSCERTIPIMGPNPERYISEHVEDFGHRTESTMWRAYNYQWASNPFGNSWEKFSLVDSHTPDYSFSGCGNIHFPPNGQLDYDWGNPESALSYCDDFENYPNLHNPNEVLKSFNCETWNCSSLGYFDWWYRHLPDKSGCGPDSVANNWWIYFAYPELAIEPVQGCLINFPYTSYLPVLIK